VDAECHPFLHALYPAPILQIDYSFSIQDATARKMEALLDTTRRNNVASGSIFPVATTMVIAPGSYFLRMPTQDGRQALVVFPPGNQSLEDIRFMHELQEGDDLPQVQSLRRVVVNDGGGAKCLLQLL
jgi:hypothetical protein